MKSNSSIKVALILTVLMLAGPATVLADNINKKAGTSAFSFLKIDIGARPMAMGGAFTGVADDETSLYYNPAGIAALEGRRFIAGYHNNFFDMQSGFLGYIHSLNEQRKVFLFVNYLNYGEFIRTNSSGVEEGGNFSGGDLMFAVGYAHKLKENFQLGGTIKLIHEKIDVFSSAGLAFDLGGRYSFDYNRTAVGFMIQNLGGQLNTFVEEDDKDPLPLSFRLGGSRRLKGLPLLVALDAVYPTDNDIYFALGLEFLKAKPLYIRLGWSSFGSNYKTGSSKDDLAGFSFGFGVDVRNIQISYTLAPQAELGTSHRITLTGGIKGFGE
jgi:hypothetical protein